ncbi:MAG TPA: toll/interleukin-1 receptor domain-containing protein [Phycisphaerales bacterium]
MTQPSPKFSLPARVDAYFAVLAKQYKKTGERDLFDIVVNGVVSVAEGWDYDNWNGGVHGHGITFALPDDLFLKVLSRKEDVQNRLTLDLNQLNSDDSERISFVRLELVAADKGNWRVSTGIYRPNVAADIPTSDELHRIWGPAAIRLFLSHKATHRVETSRLKSSLERCGVAAFVAHEDIEPTLEWQREIENALFSMDALVALLTPDFHDSSWTDQEVGVAIGRGVPVLPIRLGKDPYGLMGKSQGVSGCSLSDTDALALKVIDLVVPKLRDGTRWFECVVAAYAASESFKDSAWTATTLFPRLSSLSPAQIDRLLETHHQNAQNRESFKSQSMLVTLLNRVTGKYWSLKDGRLGASDGTTYSPSPKM